MMNLAELKQEFASPGNRFRMLPLFRVNDQIDPEELRWQIHALKQQGCGGIFSICEVFNEGAPGKFLSDWWWQVVRWLAEACAQEDLEFWVYDDEDWPSGSAGGKLLDAHPEFIWKYLHPAEHAVSGPDDLDLPLGPDLFVAAVAYQKEGEGVREESLLDLGAQVTGGRLRWSVPPGSWIVTLYTAPPGKGFFIDGYGDLMDKTAMATFVDWVHQGHWDQVAQVKDARIQGYFTDEPACSYAMIGWGDRFSWYPSLPYTPELAEAFQARHGYDPRPLLPLLEHGTSSQALRLRYRYWETCCQLYSENYFGQIYRFCEEHGVLSSGHLVVEENFLNHLAQQAGNLPTHFRYMHIPGVDWIHPFDGFINWPATTPKYATSMAHLMGRERTWCESFAAAGWGLSFQQMRRIVNWEHVNGINMQIPITYKYSLRGPQRATFFNPGLSYQQPYWDHLRAFADYEARLCVLVSGGGHRAQIALAYPGVDIWHHCWDHPLLTERSDEYNRLGDLLRANGYDFDILDDQAINEQATVRGGRLVTATETFEVMMFPRQDAVRRATLERARDLAASGGYVLFVGQWPVYSYEQGSDDQELSSLLTGMLGDEGRRAEAQGEPFVRAHGLGRVGFAPTADAAIGMLHEAVLPDLQLPDGTAGVVAYHRHLEDKDLYLVFNHSDETRTIEFTLRTAGHPEIWNPLTGMTEGVEEYAITGTGTRLRLCFPGQAMIPLLFHPAKEQAAPFMPRKTVQQIEIPGPFHFQIEETLNRPHVAWNFTQAMDGWVATATPPAAPGELPLGDWQEQGLRFFSGIGHYATSFDLDAIPAGARVILSLGRVAISAEVLVNGQNAGVVFFEPYELDITDAVKPGRNKLRIAVANTLANYFAQFKELEGHALSQGGDLPERRVSGLLGPVSLRVIQ